MLQELFNLIKGHAQDAVIDNPAVPNDQNNAVIASATHSVAEELQSTLASGGLQNVLSMFGNGAANGNSSLLNNPIVSNIISNFTNKLTNDHGIESGQASNIATSLIPTVISNLISRTNNPGDNGFNINSIISSLTGGGTSQAGAGGGIDLTGIMSRFTAGNLDTDGDGKVELSDIVSKVTGGAQNQQQQQGGGGLMDLIKGFL